MARRLDHTTRQSIAKKMREGVRPQVLAREYGVTVRTVYRCAQSMREIQIERGSRTETVVCRVSPADLALFCQSAFKSDPLSASNNDPLDAEQARRCVVTI